MIANVKPVSELKAAMPKILRDLHETRKPVLVVSKGHAEAVLQDVETYEQTQDAIALLKMMLQSEESVRAKQGSTTSQVARRLRQRIDRRERPA